MVFVLTVLEILLGVDELLADFLILCEQGVIFTGQSSLLPARQHH